MQHLNNIKQNLNFRHYSGKFLSATELRIHIFNNNATVIYEMSVRLSDRRKQYGGKINVSATYTKKTV